MSLKNSDSSQVEGRRSRLTVYQPNVKYADIYFPHPAVRPLLRYNHDADIVKFKGRFIATWNANTVGKEGVPGQFNYLSVSDDFEHWTPAVQPFTQKGDSENPVEEDNQWQPSLINYHDETLFCAWCTFTHRKTFVSTSRDGVHWTNREVAGAPTSLEGQVVGFPTTHGLLSSKDVMMFPCSLPVAEEHFVVGHTRYAGILYSEDGGENWQWSEPIEAVDWSEIGVDPEVLGTDTIILWEPTLFEYVDGRIGLLIRNSTSQDNPERAPYDKPHYMILHAVSEDHGHTWSKARPIEVDSIWTRSFAISGVTSPEGLFMVMNDMNINVPEERAFSRYFLTLYCAPICEPDLFLPGPLVQPEGGIAFYPDGFVEDGRLYLAYTYPGGIHSSVVHPLPDFSEPFLLPRGGRSGLRIEGDTAFFGQKQSSLGLVLTAELTRKPRLRLAFDINVNRYTGAAFPILTLGGKTRQGTVIRAVYSEAEDSDVFQLRAGSQLVDVAKFRMKEWNHFEIEMTEEGFSISVNGSEGQSFRIPLLRKICFGGLYEPPEWPMGVSRASDVRLNLSSIVVE